METGIDYVRLLCKERNISISKLEKDLGFSNGYLNPKKLKKVPYDRAVMIADYLKGDIKQILHLISETPILLRFFTLQ